MTQTAFDLAALYRTGLPPAQQPWGGFPPYNFVGGHNDPEGVPVEAFAEIAADILRRKGRHLATYFMDGGPQGLMELRQFVVDKLARDRGVATRPEDVLITSGSLQGLDLVNEVLLAPGDTVIVERDTYGGAITKLQRRGVNIVGAPLDEHGIRMDALADILDGLKAKGVTPKYIYTIPTVQNPTGSVMPLDRRKQLLALARQYGVAIFEDECYADLIWDGDWPPALYGLDEDDLVIHIGSFSKSLAPALRLGYVVAPQPVLCQLLAVKGDAGTGAVEQMLVAEYFGRNFEAHLAKLRPALKAKLDILTEAVEAQFGTAAEFTPPNGGIFLWVRLPEQVDTSVLAAKALEEGVAVNPGREWSVDPEATKHHIRLCFALNTREVTEAGIAKLADICHREFGVPLRSANVAR